jgi:phosphate-selective porin OprO/OprP
VARVKGNAQADARFFDGGGTNQFLVRSARPILDIDVGKNVGFRIAPELAPTPTLQDAYGSVRFAKELRLRVGKFKSPVGMERLIDEADTEFLERAFPTAIAPNRDVGVQLHGEIGPRTLTWAIGVFDGAPDGASVDGDVGDKKDVAARVFARPFAETRLWALQRLGFGVAGTYGTHAGAPASYRTSGQNVFFSFAKDVLQSGAHARFSPQASWYVGPVGAWFEWIRSSMALVDAKSRSGNVVVSAWQAGLAWVVTGEDATDEGVAPRRPFDPKNRRFGALEVVARVSELRMGAAAFDGYADAKVSARRARAMAVGATWHLQRRVKVVVDVERTTFVGGAADGDRPTEMLVGGRLQVAF